MMGAASLGPSGRREAAVGERPSGGGACCPPPAEGVTYLKLGADRKTVGMLGLGSVFQQLLALGRRPDETSDEELLGMARKSNWIPGNAQVESEYAGALREEYAVFFTRQRRDGNAAR